MIVIQLHNFYILRYEIICSCAPRYLTKLYFSRSNWSDYGITLYNLEVLTVDWIFAYKAMDVSKNSLNGPLEVLFRDNKAKRIYGTIVVAYRAHNCE